MSAPKITAEALHAAAPEFIIEAMSEYDRAGGDDGHGDDEMGVWREYADALAAKDPGCGATFPQEGQAVEGRTGTNRSGETGVLGRHPDGRWFVHAISGSAHDKTGAGPYTDEQVAIMWQSRAARAQEPKPVTYRDLPPDLQAIYCAVYASSYAVELRDNLRHDRCQYADLAAAAAEEAANEAVRRANGGVPLRADQIRGVFKSEEDTPMSGQRLTRAERDDFIDRVLLPELPPGTSRQAVEAIVMAIEEADTPEKIKAMAERVRGIGG